MSYHTLLTRDGRRWSIQFGDYDWHVVNSERADYRRQYMAQDLKIITTADDQAAIDAAVAKLNGASE